MEFSVKSGSPEKQRSACIVVGVFEPRRLSPIAEQLDKISDGYISACYVGANWKENRGRHCCCTMFQMYFPSEFSSSVAVKNVNSMSASTNKSFRKPLTR